LFLKAVGEVLDAEILDVVSRTFDEVNEIVVSNLMVSWLRAGSFLIIFCSLSPTRVHIFELIVSAKEVWLFLLKSVHGINSRWLSVVVRSRGLFGHVTQTSRLVCADAPYGNEGGMAHS
jgi:hypothetical protein